MRGLSCHYGSTILDNNNMRRVIGTWKLALNYKQHTVGLRSGESSSPTTSNIGVSRLTPAPL